jgi:hypothetical protein
MILNQYFEVNDSVPSKNFKLMMHLVIAEQVIGWSDSAPHRNL